MSLDLFADPPTWTTDDLYREKARRLAEDLDALGDRPSWWRPRARRRYDRQVLRLQVAHDKHLREMIATADPKRRAITAHLIGWRAPAERQ